MIANKTKNTIISKQEMICNTLFSQVRGLMFRKKQNVLMIFPQEQKINLHMFFVFYPIDVVILDSKMNIVEIKRNVKPFTLWNSSQKGTYLLELGFPSFYDEGDELQIS